MGTFYDHEEKEKIERYRGPRPPLPECSHDAGLMIDMYDYLADRGLSPEIASYNGWYPTTAIDYFPRIVIPCSNPSGVVYYQARAMNDRAKIRYMSPAATRADSIVYVAPATKYEKGAVIVEGPMDALAVADHEWIGIGLMGNQPGPGVVAYISLLIKHLKRVLVVPDADCVEMSAYMVGALAMHHVKAEIRTLPKGKDLAELTRKERERFLK